MSNKKIINSVRELTQEICGRHDNWSDKFNIAAVGKAVYKGTTCGAWVCTVSTESGVVGVKVGSIVEGADQCTDEHELTFPFRMYEFWGMLDLVEAEAKEIWNNTHGCEKCWPDGSFDEYGCELEYGCWPINKDCPACKGEGEII